MSEYPEERLLIQNLWERFHKDFLKTAEVADYDGCEEQHDGEVIWTYTKSCLPFRQN